MGNSQYRRQHYIAYHGYKYSLPSVAGFIRQSGGYYLFHPPEISGGQGSERVKRGSTVHIGQVRSHCIRPIIYMYFALSLFIFTLGQSFVAKCTGEFIVPLLQRCIRRANHGPRSSPNSKYAIDIIR